MQEIGMFDIKVIWIPFFQGNIVNLLLQGNSQTIKEQTT